MILKRLNNILLQYNIMPYILEDLVSQKIPIKKMCCKLKIFIVIIFLILK